MKVATFNVNGSRARIDHVRRWLERLRRAEIDLTPRRATGPSDHAEFDE